MSTVEPSVGDKRALTCQQMQAITRALADPRRYSILLQLAREPEPVTPCAAMRGCIKISPATLSHHMRELRLAGLVTAVREGRNVSYVLCREVVAAYTDLLRCDLL